jgi:hypothetical protein
MARRPLSYSRRAITKAKKPAAVRRFLGHPENHERERPWVVSRIFGIDCPSL